MSHATLTACGRSPWIQCAWWSSAHLGNTGLEQQLGSTRSTLGTHISAWLERPHFVE